MTENTEQDCVEEPSADDFVEYLRSRGIDPADELSYYVEKAWENDDQLKKDDINLVKNDRNPQSV